MALHVCDRADAREAYTKKAELLKQEFSAFTD